MCARRGKVQAMRVQSLAGAPSMIRIGVAAAALAMATTAPVQAQTRPPTAAIRSAGEVMAVDFISDRKIYHFVQGQARPGQVFETWTWMMFQEDQYSGQTAYDSIAAYIRVDCRNRTVQNLWLEYYQNNRRLHDEPMNDPASGQGRGNTKILEFLCDGRGSMRSYRSPQIARNAVDMVTANAR